MLGLSEESEPLAFGIYIYVWKMGHEIGKLE